jgi:cytochrome c oxidase assembly factor CtaG/ferredoxin
MPSSLIQAIAQSWIVPPGPTLATLALGVVYLRGWRVARVTRPRELPAWRAACFFSGLLFLWLALASPLDALDQFLLLAHMTQHVLLMSVAPPLLLLGNPVVPLLRGLPRSFVRDDLAPWMNTRGIRRLQKLVTGPIFGWITMDLAVVLWHIPAAYELALRSNFWHQIEHGCFFFTSLAFWWYAVRPWPNHIRSSKWMIIPYLASAHLVLFFVGLIIAFDPRVLYPTYADVPRLFGISAMTDQALAGGEMIIVGLVVIILSLVPVMLQLLSDDQPAARPPARATARAAAPFDLLRTPVAGRLLRSRYGRLALQTISATVMAAVILDGLFGAQIAPLNLAGSLLWNVMRSINLVLLLLVGNLFCMACPFTLPRELVRRLGIPQLRWPSWLSSKWLAAGLLLLFFWGYEQFDLWRSPRDTAFLLIAYVLSAFLINTVFLGASFCKYICPVGQFNFLASLVAPLELGARSQQICSACETHDCVRGNETHRGCELKLYVPNKVGNLDCTLCMDCVRACPSDNVSITLRPPFRDLYRDPVRSSIGRTSARPDFAALMLVIVFSSIANAGVMIAPVAHFLDSFRRHHPWAANPFASLFATCLFSAVLLVLYVGAARLLQALASRQSLRNVFCRFSLALLPLGLSIWLGHLAFHLATTWSSIPSLFQHLTMEVTTVAPASMHMMMAESSSSMFSPLFGANGLNLFDLQVWIANLGLFVTWYAGRRLICQMAGSTARIWSMSAVWMVGSTALYALAVWIFTQPMYMRGMGM